MKLSSFMYVTVIVCLLYIMTAYICFHFHMFDSSLSYVIVSNAIQTIQANINEHDDSDTYDNFTLFIGLGAQKCASTYFQQLLNHSMTFIIHRKQNFGSNCLIKQELHYWDDCIITQYVPSTIQKLNEYINIIEQKRLKNKDQMHCDFNQYLALFHRNTTNVSNVILSEKTPSYFRYYHSCYSLSFYAHLYDISFYVFLRNPIKRVWSMYWMYAKTHKQSLDPNHIKDIQLMSNKIQNDIDTLQHDYPLFNRLLSMMNIKHDTNNNHDIDEMEIVQLYIKAVYDPYSKFDIPFLMISCYYPQLLMWMYTFNHIIPKDWNLNTNKRIQNRLKVLQSEIMLQDPKNTMKEFVCWMMKNDKRKCDEIQNLLDGPSAKMSLFHNFKLKRKVETYSPNIVDVMNLSISHSLQTFYKHCNQRLYWFLQEHNDLLLPNNPFPPW